MSALRSNTYPSIQRTRKRDYVSFALSAVLLVGGCHHMGKHGNFVDKAGVDALLIGALVACCGYMLSWSKTKSWGGAMLLVALVARMMMLPMEPGLGFFRLAWDGDALSLGLNPFVDTPILGRFGTPDEFTWDELEFSAYPSRFTPMLVWLFDFLSFNADSVQWSKFVFIFLDLFFCSALVLRFGSKAASQYAWSPLAILSVAGMANVDILFLFPLGIGYLIWQQWIETSGGGSMINSNGGIGGRLGQIVCFVAFLVGLSAALNLFFIPIAIWLVIWVLRKAGVKAGAIVLAVSSAPLIVSFIWASISLDDQFVNLIPIKFAMKVEVFSFFPALIDWMAGYWLHANSVSFVAIMCFVVYSLLTNESFGRLGISIICGLILLMPLMQPWYFLWMAPFAIAMGHYGLRVASVGAFVCFLPLQKEIHPLTELDLSAGQAWLLWAPFFVSVLWFALKNPSKASGFYVRSF